MSTILDLQPASVWHYFHQLTQIPRPSHHEEAVQQYVLDEAARLGLSAERDAVGNIRVRKPASAGHEGAPGVILQGHLDMVPQKNADKVHDFTRDPITTQVHADGRVTADGTTLGADNGIGVALILAVLANKTLVHPPLEALFTSSEETGMVGARTGAASAGTAPPSCQPFCVTRRSRPPNRCLSLFLMRLKLSGWSPPALRSPRAPHD